MGTAVGISGAYIAAALGPGARLATLDRLAGAVQAARATFDAVGVADRVTVVEGRFAETLEPALQRMAPVDFMFIDGHHEEEPTLAYLETALPYLGEKAVVVFDDIDWSEGMTRAWSTVAARAPGFAAALGSLGLWAN